MPIADDSFVSSKNVLVMKFAANQKKKVIEVNKFLGLQTVTTEKLATEYVVLLVQRGE
jgi:hypothetical protein